MSTGTTDLYELLGVSRDASEDELKRAFRRKARECHPDVCDDPDAEDRFKRLNEAYDVLSDPSKRERYDRFGVVDGGAGAPGGAPGGQGFGFGMDDLFSVFFGGGGFAGNRPASPAGRDMAIQVTVSLEEAARGVEKEIVLDRLAPCDTCGASGVAEGGHVVSCPDCGGTGHVRMQRRTLLGIMETLGACDRCSQTGRIAEPACEECAGSGRVPDRQRVNLKVPAGVDEGMRLSVAGMGEAGIRGAASGTLYATVRIAQHEFLHREGDNLHAKLPISISQAALGAVIEEQGLLEKVTAEVPAGVQHGDVVRVRGMGMPNMRNGARGDLNFHIAVEVPKKLTKRQRELLSELADELGDGTPPAKSRLHRLRDWLIG